jgi:NitT/TauT family transport system substrate-binding protein
VHEKIYRMTKAEKSLNVPFFCTVHALIFLFVLFSSNPSRGEDLKKVTIVPQWQPQAQFAGYYVAKEKGIYKKYGLDVTILRGGPEYPSLELLADGKADFATLFLTTGIQQRARGVNIVNIGQIVQHSGFMLVAKKSSGILKPEDLQGKTVSIWSDFSLQPMAFFRKYGLDVKIVPQTATMNLFLRGGTDAASAMWYNEYHLLLNSGIDEDELTTFFFKKYDLDFPEDGIYCLKETYERDRKLCCNFVKASLEGWRYAFEYPNEALDIVMKYVKEAHVGTNRIHQKWMLERMNDIIVPGNNVPMGSLSEEDYHAVARELKLSDCIKQIPDFDGFYVNCSAER